MGLVEAGHVSTQRSPIEIRDVVFIGRLLIFSKIRSYVAKRGKRLISSSESFPIVLRGDCTCDNKKPLFIS
jgi:hypothetical protein